MIVPGGGMVTIKIHLPEAWNMLMKEKGYEPLESFYLKSELKPESNPRKFSNYNTRNHSRHSERRYNRQSRE